MKRSIAFLSCLLVFVGLAYPSFSQAPEGSDVKLGEHKTGLNDELLLMDRTSGWSDLRCIVGVYHGSDGSFSYPIETCESQSVAGENSPFATSPSGNLRSRIIQERIGGDVLHKLEVLARFDAPGVYRVRRTFSGHGVGGQQYTYIYKAYWVVVVPTPFLPAPIDLDTLHVGEKKAICFATQGHEDYDQYSYKVFREEVNNRTEITSGRGPYVVLDFMQNVIGNVDRTFTLEGYYNGSLFTCVEPGSAMTIARLSKWGFYVAKPEELIPYNITWADESDFDARSDRVRPIIPMDCDNDPAACEFMFVFATQRGNNLVAASSAGTSVRVVSEPEDFLGDPAETIPEEFGVMVRIHPNMDFLKGLRVDAPTAVTLVFNFTSSLGEETKVYKAYVAWSPFKR
jgi:hypothetical protein